MEVKNLPGEPLNNNETPGGEEELLALLLAEEGFAEVSPAQAISRRQATASPPLSFAQRRLWFLDQLAPGSPTYHIPLALHLCGHLNKAALAQSLGEIVRRHEALRTTFALVDDQLVQVIAPGQTIDPWPLPLINCSLSEAQHLAVQEACRPFDLTQGPLLRTKLLRLSEDEHLLLLTMHHTIGDGWSLGVFYQELAALYAAFATGGSSPLPDLPIQYADFSAWQQQELQGEVLESHLAYWRKQLAGAPPVLSLPTDHTNPPQRSYRPGAFQSFKLSQSVTQALQALSAQAGTTLFMTLLAAFKVLLYRYTRQEDISVGSLTANRNRSEIEGLIGVFINALTLRTDLSGNPTFIELLHRVRETALEAYAHQDLPFEILVEELHPERDLRLTPLFQVMFVFQDVPIPAVELPGLTMQVFEFTGEVAGFDFGLDTGTAVYDLFLEMTEKPDGLIGAIRYDTDLFEAATITRMIGHFETLLAGIVADPSQRISTLPLLLETERQQLLLDWNNTRQAYPLELCAHQLIEARAAQTPDAVAVVCAGEQLTYRQLNRRANRLARSLVEAGVGPEVVVALLAERGLDLLTMILAVFKAGGAYLPLDPLHPAQRIAQILQRSRSPLVLTTPNFISILGEALDHLPAEEQPQIFELETLLQPDRPDENLPLRCQPGSLAYVIYTSGSTGLPKGAMVQHIGMLNHLFAKITDLHLAAADRIAQNSSQCFDISVWQFLAALLVGGQVHIFKNEIAYDPLKLLKHVQNEKITILQVVPSMLRAIIQTAAESGGHPPELPALRWVVPTGEALTTELARQWLNLYPQIPMMNAYGSTECSDDQCHHPIYQAPVADFELPTMPIGRPLANTQVYILDRRLSPVPIGIAGELYIGGIGVGRGYLNEPQRTAEVFVPDPFTAEPGQRLYKTGDLARYLPDGVIEFLGRVDFMVKVRGFRIELGEIEATLEQHPAIQQVVVLAPGNERLVAYVVPQQQPGPTLDELRSYLKQKLPEYMVPSIFIPLEAIPLNPNGKIDRKALPQPDLANLRAAETYLAPRTPTEETLAGLWATVLGLERVGVRDNFFELGGHSLLAVRLMAHIHKQFSQDLPLAVLFQGATIEHLAGLLDRQAGDSLYSPLVAIQPIGADRTGSEAGRFPFFLVHPADGAVLSYINLARHLGPDQPFYGLQAVGLNGEQPPHTRIEAMAAAYIQALQTVQPDGPYLLGGWSMGSIVAFEMAQQLYRQGQSIAVLALLDHWAPSLNSTGAEADDAQDDPLLLTAFLKDLRGRFAKDLPALAGDWDQLGPEEQLNFILENARTLEVVLPDGGLLQMHRLLQVFKANVRAMWRYTPQIYEGRILLFKAGESLVAAQTGQAGFDDPTLGWGQLSTHPVEVRLVPGDHYSMLAEPHVQVLAGQLRVYLDQIEAAKEE